MHEFMLLNRRLAKEGLRYCKGCGQTLPLSEFGLKTPGYQSRCRPCQRKEQAQWKETRKAVDPNFTARTRKNNQTYRNRVKNDADRYQKMQQRQREYQRKRYADILGDPDRLAHLREQQRARRMRLRERLRQDPAAYRAYLDYYNEWQRNRRAKMKANDPARYEAYMQAHRVYDKRYYNRLKQRSKLTVIHQFCEQVRSENKRRALEVIRDAHMRALERRRAL